MCLYLGTEGYEDILFTEYLRETTINNYLSD